MSKENHVEEAIPADAVIQALKCCAATEDNCYHCPFNMKGAGIISEGCITAMSRAALDLIYRKQSGDMVEVVRCKDCALRYTGDCASMQEDDTDMYFRLCDDDEFCSSGVRKE